MTFGDFQQDAAATDRAPQSVAGEHLVLLGLVTQVGQLSEIFKKRLRDEADFQYFKRQAGEQIGDLLWYTAALAKRLDLKLDDIATRLLEENRRRWIAGPTQASLFDNDRYAPPSQQLPRKFVAKFETIPGTLSPDLPQTIVTLNGKPFGDPIDDNERRANNYRFHDALHLANVVFLNWSPVVRSLTQSKRKCDPLIDRCEDGARSIQAEEEIVNYVYSVAEKHNFWVNSTTIDTSILNKIQDFLKDWEVASRTQAEWEQCILYGYKVFNELVKAQGGYLIGDIDKRSLTYQKDPP